MHREAPVSEFMPEVEIMVTAEYVERCRMTFEEFEALPEGPPFYDYIDGWAIRLNRPTKKHQDIQHALLGAVKHIARTARLGWATQEIDVKLPSGDWVGPDIIFVGNENNDRYNVVKGDLYGNPDLVVEISSPSTDSYDRVDKYKLYEKNGVPWLWFIHQDSLAIEEYRWTPDGYLRVSTVGGGAPFRPVRFPGFEIDLAALLAAQEDVTERGEEMTAG